MIRPRLTYSNVVSTLCLFLLVGGGAAYAAGKLAKNSVGPNQLKKNSVTTAKIKTGAVTAAKIANGTITGTQVKASSLTGANVADGSLTGANINQSTLNSVRASNVYGVALNGNCTAAAPFPSGVSASAVGTSGCKVDFPGSVLNCAATATPALRTSGLIVVETRTVETLRNPLIPNEIKTFAKADGSNKQESVDLTLVC
ncbi:MAG TPA: hypothetical protein VH476_06790 [Solirubrobacterales bacterium]